MIDELTALGAIRTSSDGASAKSEIEPPTDRDAVDGVTTHAGLQLPQWQVERRRRLFAALGRGSQALTEWIEGLR
jgi:hypothetical protein